MFTAFQSICGALLIQFATTAFVAEAGKTVGFSSIAYNVVAHPGVYPVTIVLGMLLATLTVATYLPQFLPPPSSSSALVTCLSGALVGLGTSWGSGCTSGHMLCGLSLLRLRSLVATLVFSTTAMLVVNGLDLAPSCGASKCRELAPDTHPDELWQLGLLVVAGFFVSKLRIHKALTGLKVGFLFGLGLFVSGMANPAKPQGFLAVFAGDKWDPSLAMIVLFAILPNIIEWQLVLRSEPRPVFEPTYTLPSATGFPPKFLLGCAIFGVGWGLKGVCPGPGILNAVLSKDGAAWLASFWAGYALARRF